MKLLITGANGQLGGQLLRLLTPDHLVTATDINATQHIAALDISDWQAVRTRINDEKPDMVIHTAAWTDVDGCARDPQRAIRINGYGAQNVAVAAHEVGAAMIHISTNEVFDGTQQRPYYEYDSTNPVNPYGYSKWVAEQAVMRLNPRHYIVRTAWLFAHGGRNFIHAIWGAARDGRSLRVVTNEVANPTYTNDLAHAITQLMTTGRYGIYHLVNEGAVSRYDFARYILDKAGFADVPVERISGQQWVRPSRPPVYASMANIAAADLGVRLRSWQVAVDAFLKAESLVKA